ncbi:DUF4118 domain-containing protein [Bittarella sp. HCP28S3_D9]|uniref:DUF4118 domain-containing protein n=1 Tax=Bittarella sp. HCP28S3_D9 TaxID=3440253 RepID=UPI003F8C0B4B
MGPDRARAKGRLLHLGQTVLILLVCTAVAALFDRVGIRQENITMVYLTGVLVIVVETGVFFWGIVASLVCVFVFNFLFTQPRLTFRIADPSYIVTLILFLLVSLIAASLTSQLQRHAQLARKKEDQTQRLYEISRSFLNLSGLKEVVCHGVASIYEGVQRRCVVYLIEEGGGLSQPYYLPGHYLDGVEVGDDTLAKWCLKEGEPCGCGTENFAISQWRYAPFKSGSRPLGVVEVYCGNAPLGEEETLFIDTVISQLALAVEREQLYALQQRNQVEIEKEKLRNNLLRAVSHDLRTPLTGIGGSAEFLRHSYDQLDRETAMKLLGDISGDVAWLESMVENLLNMTRIQDGKLALQVKNEVVDDVVAEATARLARLPHTRPVAVSLPDELLLAPMDGKLMVQVLVNLLGNAVAHTPDSAAIRLAVHGEGERVVFEVSDNGGGVAPELLPHLFDSFVTSPGDSRRGIGLGLSICQSIVQAHGGGIEAENNDIGGATFRFWLPLEKSEEEGKKCLQSAVF